MTGDDFNSKNAFLEQIRTIVREELQKNTKVPAERRYLTPAEAGIVMGYKKRTVYQLMKDGILPYSAFSDDGVLKVDRHDIEKLFKQRKNI